MPAISMFYGILVRMFFAPKEHNPPHIHTYYQGKIAVFDIQHGNLITGEMPLRQTRLIPAWIEIYREELLANWELCQNGERPFTIKPLN